MSIRYLIYRYQTGFLCFTKNRNKIDRGPVVVKVRLAASVPGHEEPLRGFMGSQLWTKGCPRGRWSPSRCVEAGAVVA